MPNRLAHESSPYLRQHADNPVEWHPWGPEALARATAMDKPILLSVGYAACHWCHVMAHESFEDEATAALMNAHFVNIKLDREERPDLDAIYQGALAVMGEQGGWPLTMFLTPDGKPFTGGTYYPPAPRYGRPSFRQLLTEIARLWREDRARVTQAKATLMPHLERLLNPVAEGELTLQGLDAIAAKLLKAIDPAHGGVGSAPKFPNTPLLEFLWRAYFRTGDESFSTAVINSLTHMCQGGIYDHLGGGFARYSVDREWLTPHFEKMLADNAQIISLLSLVWLKTKSPLFKSRVEETVGWALREMRVDGAGFAASLDADSEGEEGRFYVWSRDQIEHILDAANSAIFCSAYGVTAQGNFEGQNILNRLGALGLGDEAHEMRLRSWREKLLAARATRVRPRRDGKVLADWNGLMIKAFAEAGAAFGRADWLEAARGALRDVSTQLIDSNRIYRAKGGVGGALDGLAEDYAALIGAALALAETTGENTLLAAAEGWVKQLEADNSAAGGGFHQARSDSTDTILRSRTIYDNAVPPANATMIGNYARLFAHTGQAQYLERAQAIIRLFAGVALEAPGGTASFLNGFDLFVAPVSVVIVAPPARGFVQVAEAAPALATIARACAQPNKIVSWCLSAHGLPPSHPAHGKVAIAGKPTAYVCRGQTCSAPVTEPAELARLLGE
jgi:hypothetical protein